jgi:7,8-dihydropterin-6-yl-methyl-4-(beta-D-ribofuranosyl)aminobenzene 5'-phosphate synthase
MNKMVGVGAGLLALAGGGVALLALRYERNRQRADETWRASVSGPVDIEAVEQLRVMPLVDARSTHDGLITQSGVSYLVEADGVRLLFDLGHNAERETPSPLEQNAATLGVNLEALDAVVISHRHFDHVGGLAAQLAHSFTLPAAVPAQDGVPVYLPEPLHHPTADTRLVEGPQRIAPGVATIGPIARALFFLGWTPEQALAANVAGKGIVLIIGCGHQGVRRIVERAGALFDEPLYGIIGGLHLPATGLGVHRLVGTGQPPWAPPTTEDVAETIAFLKAKGIARVALSPHDSCDWTLDAFADAWGPAFEVVTVGTPIEIHS